MPPFSGRETDSGSAPVTTSAAVRLRAERDALDDVLQSMEAEHGAVDECDVAAIMDRLAR